MPKREPAAPIGAINVLLLAALLERIEGSSGLFNRATAELRDKIQRIINAPSRYDGHPELIKDALALANSSKIARAIEDLEAARSGALSIINDMKRLVDVGGRISEA